MKQFKYNAVDPNGKKIQGLVEANDKPSAVSVLHGKGLLVTKLYGMDESIVYQFNLRFSSVSGSDLVYFTRQFATMIHSGLSIISALNILQKKAKPALARVIDDIIASIEGGETLYQALSQHVDVFSPLYISLVKAGELSGSLSDVMLSLAANLERDRQFRAKVKGAMLYPTIMFFAMIVVAIVMIFFVMPKVTELYNEFDAELPFMTEIILSVSSWIRSFWYVFLIAIVGLVAGFARILNTSQGRDAFDRYILQIPYWGELQHKIISTNIVRTLALLIRSGVSIVEALEIVSNIASNIQYKRGIRNASSNVEKGVTLSSSLAAESFFPEMVIQMIAVGEETGKLDNMLDRVADQFQNDSISALKALTSAIEPTMIIVLGLGVGVLVFAIIMPIYNLTSQI